MNKATLQQMVRHRAYRRYKNLPFPRGRDFNQMIDELRKAGFPCSTVNRKDESVYMYTDRMIKESPPTIIDRRLGNEFINACLMLGLPWEEYVIKGRLPDHLQNLKATRFFHGRHAGLGSQTLDRSPDSGSDNGIAPLKELFDMAVQECEDYYYEFGGLDFWHPFGYWAERKPRIGDDVQIVRRSSDDLELLYGEPEEDRCTYGLQVDRPDGDHRWEPMDDDEFLWDPPTDTFRFIPTPSGKSLRVRISAQPIVVGGDKVKSRERWDQRCALFRKRKARRA